MAMKLQQHHHQSGDRLYSLQGTLELQPQLAKELPKVSKDGLKYTIPLREGHHFPRRLSMRKR